MHRRSPATVAAERDREAPTSRTSPCVRAGLEMWALEGQAVISEEPQSAAAGVLLGEEAIEQLLVCDQRPTCASVAGARDERHRRQPIAHREQSFGVASFAFR